MNLILIRHGQSEANLDESLYHKIPDHDIKLTQKGIEQAQNLYKVLKSDYKYRTNNYIIHSPWERAKRTAYCLSELSIHPFIEDPLTHEIAVVTSYSDMKLNKDFYNKDKSTFSPFWYKDGTTESYKECYLRARIFVQDLKLNKYNLPENSNVFIVSHGLFLQMVKGVLLNYTVEEILNTQWMGNCETFQYVLKTI